MSSTPEFLGFEIQKVTNGAEELHGAGELSSLTVSSVPVPASVWLFLTAIAGLAVRARCQD